MPILPGRFAAAHSESLVVFLIGMRINRFLRPDKWMPAARAMPVMLAELEADAASGFLGAELLYGLPRLLITLQYWRDFESLEAYAHARDRQHWPAWAAFNKAAGEDRSVGLFHEAYRVEAGRIETVYGDMPPYGLGRVSGLIPATASRHATLARMRSGAVGE